MFLIHFIYYLCFVSIDLLCVDGQSTDAERTIQNPGYVELGPCPCDVSGNLCDFNCCCDNDCTTQDRARFEYCIPGLRGGQDGPTEKYKCGTNEYNPPDWHKLTCVYWENNAYLGMFFMNKAKLSTVDPLIAVTKKYTKKTFTLSEQERRYTDKDFAVQNYRQGIILVTRQSNKQGILSLPQQINGGQCNLLAPLRFLEPLQSSCQSSLTIQSCGALTIFSADIYALPTDSTRYQVQSALESADIAERTVRYFCINDITNYEPVSTPSLGNLQSTAQSNFPNDLQNVNCERPCSDPTCWQYNSNRAFISVYDHPLPLSRCNFDDGQTPPPTPSVNGLTCENVVLEVRYSFEWAGSKIEKLTADVILANVPTSKVLAQRFSVKWTHKTNSTSSTVNDNYYNSSEPYQRSGISGYDPGKPLQSGCAQRDPTTNAFQSISSEAEKEVAVWRPGVNGLCADAQRESLSFGEDVMSSCVLRLALADLNSCDNLRQLIENHLNVLMPSDVIGRYGYNDPTNEAMWISVLRQNLTTVYQAEAAATANIGPLTPLQGNETFFRLADSINGRCFLPTSINLNILYAKTGAINFHPRFEIIGAYINYTLSNWTMECMGSNSGRCDSASGQVQNFLLHSTVQFVKVPSVPPKPRTSFHTRIDPETCDSDSCERYREYWATDICYYDTCWEKLMYPLTSAYDGDSHEYALAVFLLLVLGIVGYASVAKPGWN